MNLDDAHARLQSLRHRLSEIVDKEPDQEVGGIALRVIDAVVNASRPLIKSGDEVGAVIRNLVSPDAPSADEGPVLRAVEALIVVEQLIYSLNPLPQPEPISYEVPGGNVWDMQW